MHAIATGLDLRARLTRVADLMLVLYNSLPLNNKGTPRGKTTGCHAGVFCPFGTIRESLRPHECPILSKLAAEAREGYQHPKKALYSAFTATSLSWLRIASIKETSLEPWFTIEREIPADASARHAFASIPGV